MINFNIKSIDLTVMKGLEGTYIGSKASKYGGLLILIVSFLLYGNTLTHQFALDDAIVITNNQYTQQGVDGIGGILTKDTFFGFFKKEGKANLVAGGRYRPLSLVGFAIGYQLWGDNPMWFHLFNILWFAVLGYLMMLVLSRFSRTKDILGGYFPLLIAILFISHPIHTEVVANIKGRDEIYAFIGSIAAVLFISKYIETKKIHFQVLGLFVFLLALMSKENAITFLAIAPLAYFLLDKRSIRHSIISTWPLWVATLIFLGIRYFVLGLDFGGSPKELMNNPFIKLGDKVYVDFSFSEKMATIMHTLGLYLKLFLVPHPLTHDYYPRHITQKSFGDLSVILSCLAYVAMIVFAFIKMKKMPIVSFSILFFLASLSIVSNIVFPVGTNMAERFVFMPSFGYAIVSGLLIWKLIQWNKQLGLVCLGIIICLYSFKTITRNQVWKDDYTLFTTDVKISKNSAKCLNAAGGVIQTRAFEMEESTERTKLLEQGVKYLHDAINIHPNYKNAHLLLGNSYYYLKQYNAAIKSYENALRISPDYEDARKNLGISYREYGRQLGEKQQNLTDAVKYLKKSLEIEPDNIETLRLLGVAHGIGNMHAEAIKYFEKVIAIDPKAAAIYSMLSIAYRNNGEDEKANSAYNKAVSIDPEKYKIK